MTTTNPTPPDSIEKIADAMRRVAVAMRTYAGRRYADDWPGNIRFWASQIEDAACWLDPHVSYTVCGTENASPETKAALEAVAQAAAQELRALHSQAELEKSNRWGAGFATANIVLVGEIAGHLKDFHLRLLDGHELAKAIQETIDRHHAPKPVARCVKSDPEREAPEELFDSYSVLKELTTYEQARTSAENVTDVLNATVRLIRKRIDAARASEETR